MAEDGSIYISTASGKLYALDPNGSRKWDLTADLTADGLPDTILASPAIGGDGTIYFGSWTGKFYALDPGGTKMWAFIANDSNLSSSPAIDGDGTVYFGAIYRLGGTFVGRVYALR